MELTSNTTLRKYSKFSFGLAILVPLCLGPAVAQTSYKVTDLGTLGGNNSIPFRINNRGQVVGVAETSKADPNSKGSLISHAFFWDDGVMRDLGTLAKDSRVWNSQAHDINNHGQVVGWSNTDVSDPITHLPEIRAFLWDDGVIKDLGTLGGNNSAASGINDDNEVVGYTEIPALDPTSPPFLESRAFLWEEGVMENLGTLDEDGPNSFASSIDERGDIVGASQVNTSVAPLLGFPPFHSFLWREDRMKDLNTLGIGSNAVAVNTRAGVVGRFAAENEKDELPVSHAYLWEKGTTRDLGTVSGLEDSEAQGINNKGQIVGDSGMGPIESFTPQAAWRLKDGVLTDLNTLVDSDFQLIVAFDVNARGQIVACGVEKSTGNIHAILLDPSDEDARRARTPVDAYTRQSVARSENVLQLRERGKLRRGYPPR